MHILRIEERKARKLHKCFGCCEPIQPKERYTFVISVDGGELIQAKWCKYCAEIIDAEGCSEGDLREESLELRNKN